MAQSVKNEAQLVKNPPAMQETACNTADPGLILGLGRPPKERNGNPPQYSCLEKSHGQKSLAGCSPWGCKSQTQLSH